MRAAGLIAWIFFVISSAAFSSGTATQTIVARSTPALRSAAGSVASPVMICSPPFSQRATVSTFRSITQYSICCACSNSAIARPGTPKPTTTTNSGLTWCPSTLSIDLAHHDVDRPDDRRDVGQQDVAAQFAGDGEVHEGRPADLHAVRDGPALAFDVEAEVAAGVLVLGVDFPGRDLHVARELRPEAAGRN